MGVQLEGLDFLYTPSARRRRGHGRPHGRARRSGRLRHRGRRDPGRDDRRSAGAPRILLTDHLDGDRPILVYRVADLRAADGRPRRAWLDARAVTRDPAWVRAARSDRPVAIGSRSTRRAARRSCATSRAGATSEAPDAGSSPGESPAPAVRALAGRRVGGAGKSPAGTTTLAGGACTAGYPRMHRGLNRRPDRSGGQPVAIPRWSGGFGRAVAPPRERVRPQLGDPRSTSPCPSGREASRSRRPRPASGAGAAWSRSPGGSSPGRSGRARRLVRVEVAEERDELGVELRPGVLLELDDRRVVRHRPLVRPVVGHRVVGIGDRDDPGAERDLVRRAARTDSRGRRSARGGGG